MRAIVSSVLASLLVACAHVSAGPGNGGAQSRGWSLRSQRTTICIVDRGRLIDLQVQYESIKEDTLINGRLFSAVHPVAAPTYAGSTDWFQRQQPITYRGRRYPPYGPLRVLPRSLLTRVGDYEGTPLFAERGVRNGVVAVLYVPVRPGCIFQTYMPVESSQ